jgi:hypothetical protein
VGTDLFYRTIAQSSYYNIDKWEFLQAIRDKKSKYTSLLDIGCGEGAFLDLVKSKILY